MTPANELVQLLRGRGAHADPLACIEDLPQDSATKQVTGFPHSIFALVFHMNYWMDYELRRIAGEKPPYPEHASESWPLVIAPSQWAALVSECRDLLARFAALAGSSPQQMQRAIDAMHAGHASVAGSLGAVLWQMVAHNSYHTGQIVLLRKALGEWPPPQGGDTW